MGWGGGRARCADQGGCCVLTEDFPVVQAEHAPESGHLAVPFLPAVSAFRGWPAEVGRAGTLKGGRSELDQTLLPCPGCGAGLVRGFFSASASSPIKGGGCLAPQAAARIQGHDALHAQWIVPAQKCSLPSLLIAPSLGEHESAVRN